MFLPTGTFFGIFFVGIVLIAIVATVFYLGAVLSSSGRGLETDDWELDHSVWTDRLEKDFEDSWIEE